MVAAAVGFAGAVATWALEFPWVWNYVFGSMVWDTAARNFADRLPVFYGTLCQQSFTVYAATSLLAALAVGSLCHRRCPMAANAIGWWALAYSLVAVVVALLSPWSADAARTLYWAGSGHLWHDARIAGDLLFAIVVVTAVAAALAGNAILAWWARRLLHRHGYSSVSSAQAWIFALLTGTCARRVPESKTVEVLPGYLTGDPWSLAEITMLRVQEDGK